MLMNELLPFFVSNWMISFLLLGTHEGGAVTDNLVWKLVDRFDAKLRSEEIVSVHNDGPTEIPEKHIYKTGMTVNQASSASQSDSLETSLTTSAKVSDVITSASLEAGLKNTIGHSLSKSSSETKDWSEETTTTWTIPPYTNYIVTRTIVDFTGRVPGDDLTVHFPHLDITATDIPHKN